MRRTFEDSGFRRFAWRLSVVLVLAAVPTLADPDEPSREERAAPAAPEEKKPPALNELEEGFQKTLTNATLVGRWRLVQDGKLGEEKEEKYTIQSVTKAGANLWIIVARIQFGEKDVSIPVPVEVKWAGDTPIISVTDAGLPGLGTYTARVMVYRDLYTGTWFGPGHGGMLSGTIVGESKDLPKAGNGKQAGKSEK